MQGPHTASSAGRGAWTQYWTQWEGRQGARCVLQEESANLLKSRAWSRGFRARMYKTGHLAAQLRCKNGAWICRLPPGRDAGVEQT